MTLISVPAGTQIGVGGGLSGCHVKVVLPLGQPLTGGALADPLGGG
jgi:hypothetical protein